MNGQTGGPDALDGSFRADAKEVDEPTDAGGGTRTKEGVTRCVSKADLQTRHLQAPKLNSHIGKREAK
jgi:hypothetical protein